MKEECQCGDDCPLCEGCNRPECECTCDSDIERDDDEIMSDADW